MTTQERIYKGYRFRANDLPNTPKKRISKRADRAGETFGRLSVIEDLGVAGRGNRWWGCLCTCGARIAVRSRELIRGHTKSCGCLSRELASKRPSATRLPFGEASFGVLFGQYQRSARYRNLAFELTREEFAALTKQPCAYCGAPPSNLFSGGPGVNGHYLANGVDRFDNSKGYTTANSRPCCTECNMAKGRMPATRWMAWLTRIALHRYPRIDLRPVRDEAA